jgi:hypothetical protein
MENENKQTSPQPERQYSHPNLRNQALGRNFINKSYRPGHDQPPQVPRAKKRDRLKEVWQKLGWPMRILIILGFIFIIGATYWVINKTFLEESVEPTASFVDNHYVAPIYSPLSGVATKQELADRPVTGIMIENSLDARPQSGLQEAGVIFEAIAEGGITRFLTLYQENEPSYIGPVRSLRPYYIDWAETFDASVAHVGGSPDALSRIRNGGKDLDQFFNASSFWRISSRASPHNVYTSFNRLNSLNKARGYKTSKFTPWTRKDEAKVLKNNAKTINFAISGPLYNVRYVFTKATNSYKRSEGGVAHNYTSVDGGKAKQLTPKVVIAMVMPYGIASDGHHSTYATTGKGRVFIFQDGGVVKGTWHKNGRSAQYKFVDKHGKVIALNRGQTWVTIVSSDPAIKYSK